MAGKRLVSLRSGLGALVAGLVVDALRAPENVTRLLAVVERLGLPERARRLGPRLPRPGASRSPAVLAQRLAALELLLEQRGDLFPPQAPVARWRLSVSRLGSALELVSAGGSRQRRARLKELVGLVNSLQDEVLAAMLDQAQEQPPEPGPARPAAGGGETA